MESCYNCLLFIKNWSKNVAKTAKQAEKPKTSTASFVENVNKTGTELNGRRINFGFTRRKRKNPV